MLGANRSLNCSLDSWRWWYRRLEEGLSQRTRVLSWFLLISAWEAKGGHLSCAEVCGENSGWVSKWELYILLDVVNFIVLGAGYFYIPVNIFELCFRIQLSYLEMVWSFQVFFYDSLEGFRALSSLGIISTTEARPSGIFYSMPHELWVFSVWLMEAGLFLSLDMF